MTTRLLLLSVLALTGCQSPPDPPADNTSQAGRTPDLSTPFCQDDVRQCANGQTVRRDPANNCEFTACPTAKACTKDLKICDNGRSVGRDPMNNCAFHPCDVPPAGTQKPAKEPMMCTQEVKQCPDGSHVGRDSYNNCAFKPCPNGRSDTH